MRRFVPLTVLVLGGCSTAPVADTLDCLFPSKAGRNPDYPTRPPDDDRIPPPPVFGPSDPPPAGLSDPIPAPVIPGR
jgi:hypothetical protein